MILERILKRHIDLELKNENLYGDKVMLIVLLFHWLIASSLMGVSFNSYLFGFLNGAVLSLIVVITYVFYRGTSVSRLVFATIIMAYSMLFIQQHMGRIEIHFHIFVGIAFLSIYKDYRPAILAGAVIIAYYLVANELQSRSEIIFDIPVYIFNYGYGLDIVFLHTIFVLLEVGTLSLFIRVNKERFISVVDSKFRFQELSARQELEITERTRELMSAKEDAESANRAKSSFLANMSHEIRTPLNAILGFIDILQEQESNAEKLKYIHTIKESGSSLIEIINDILDFAKVESGSLSVENVSVNPHKEFDNIARLFFAKSEEMELEFHLYIDPSLPTCIKADPLRIRQVVTNLLSNAMKFSLKGGKVLLEIKYDRIEQNLSIKVYDRGVGIEQKNLEKIFRAFSQAEDSTTREFGGTGLGLAISSRLVELMGGELKVKSELGLGSEFYFTLHIDVCEEESIFDIIPDLKGIRAAMFCEAELQSDFKVLEEYLLSFGMQDLSYFETADTLNLQETALIIMSSTLFTVEEVERLLEKGFMIIMIKTSLAEHYSNIFKGNIVIIDPPFSPSNIYDSLVTLFVKKEEKETIKYENVNTQMRGKVLVVEDQEANQYLMSVILQQLHLEFSFADDGLEAVKMFEEQSYDLIFMDENMPNMNGIEATARMLNIEKEKDLVHTPIVALTANAISGDRERFLSAGMDGYLAKPIEREKLEGILDRFISYKREEKSQNFELPSYENISAEELIPETLIEKVPQISAGVDVSALAEKMGYDEEDIEVMLSMLLAKIDTQLKNIEEAIKTEDYETIFMNAHAIKGSAGNIGLDHIFELTKQMENSARNSEEIDYKESFLRLKTMFENLKGAVDV